MGWRDVLLSATVTTSDTGIDTGGEGVVVGDPPVWRDDSDATYASFGGHYFGDGEPQFYGSSASTVDSTVEPLAGLVMDVRVRVRLVREAGTNPRMPRFRLQQNISGGHQITVAPQELAPASATWVDYPFVLTETQAQSFKEQPTLWGLTVLPPSYSSPGVPNELQRWTVFEARLQAGVRGAAPPLRQLGRRDGLGLAPSKSILGGRSIQGTLRRHGPGTFL